MVTSSYQGYAKHSPRYFGPLVLLWRILDIIKNSRGLLSIIYLTIIVVTFTSHVLVLLLLLYYYFTYLVSWSSLFSILLHYFKIHTTLFTVAISSVIFFPC